MSQRLFASIRNFAVRCTRPTALVVFLLIGESALEAANITIGAP
jgi:hypothetical protein